EVKDHTARCRPCVRDIHRYPLLIGTLGRIEPFRVRTLRCTAQLTANVQSRSAQLGRVVHGRSSPDSLGSALVGDDVPLDDLQTTVPRGVAGGVIGIVS